MIAGEPLRQAPAASKRTVTVMTILVTALVLAAIWGGVAYALLSKRTAALAANRAVLARLTDAVEQHIEGQFRSAALVREVLLHWLDTHPDSDPREAPEFANLVDSFAGDTASFGEYRLFTADGGIYVAGTGPVRSLGQMRSIDDVAGFMTGPPGRTVLGRVVRNAEDGHHYLPILTRIPTRKDGIAAVGVAIQMDAIEAMFERTRLQPDGTVALFRDDGVLCARAPPLPSTQQLRELEFLDRLKKSPSGIYDSVHSGLDGKSRVISYARVGDTGAVVGVAASTSAVLTPWRHEAVGVLAAALVLSLAIVGVAAALIRLLGDVVGHAAHLRESEALLVKAQEIARLGTCRVDLDAGRWWLSGEAAGLVGQGSGTIDEILPGLLTRIHPADVGALRSGVQAAMQRGGTTEFDFRLRSIAGAERHLHAVSIFERNSAGRMTGVLGVVQDVTQRTRMERDLREAKERAEHASRAKSEFLANMSHELRTPLNAIIGFSDVMRSGLMGPITVPKYREYLDDIGSSAEHLLAIINDILDVARIEAGRLELREAPTDLYRLVEDCVRLVQPRADVARIVLDADLVPDLPALVADERLIRQVLLNLLANAIKFTPAGGRIGIAAGLTQTGDLMIKVQDSGIGMTAAEVAEALRPFGQVQGVHVRNTEGVGLGLPLALSFIELHGGTMEIESAPRLGTTAIITLPATRLQRQAAVT